MPQQKGLWTSVFRQKLHDGIFGASNSQTFRVLWVLCPHISRIIRIPLYKSKPRISPPLVSTWTWVQRMKALSTSARSRRWHRWHPTVVVNGWYRKIHGWVIPTIHGFMDVIYGLEVLEDSWIINHDKARIRFWGPIQEGLKGCESCHQWWLETSNWLGIPFMIVGHSLKTCVDLRRFKDFVGQTYFLLYSIKKHVQELGAQIFGRLIFKLANTCVFPRASNHYHYSYGNCRLNAFMGRKDDEKTHD
jgi:hypothetical protein